MLYLRKGSNIDTVKKSHQEQRNNLTFSVTSFEALIHFHFIPLIYPYSF